MKLASRKRDDGSTLGLAGSADAGRRSAGPRGSPLGHFVIPARGASPLSLILSPGGGEESGKGVARHGSPLPCNGPARARPASSPAEGNPGFRIAKHQGAQITRQRSKGRTTL